ncbi:MAG: NosD domain-containing protein [Candidatus Thermoplasmatota archaeon]
MHRKSLFTLLIAAFFVLNFFFISLNTDDGYVSAASKPELWVDDDFSFPEESDGSIGKPFTTIRSAVDAAEDGYIIKVKNGDYPGDLTIDKSVTLIGESIEKTFIYGGSKTPYLIDIAADNVTIRNFKIWDTTPTSHRKAVINIDGSADGLQFIGNVLNESRNGFAINVENSDGALIQDNRIVNTKGLRFVDSSSNLVFNNSINNCGEYAAIRLRSTDFNIIVNNTLNSSKHGVYLLESSNNEIKGNKIFDNTLCGVKIQSGTANVVEDNEIENQPFGVKLDGKSHRVKGNTFDSSELAVDLKADNSKIFQNSFTNQVTSIDASSKGSCIYNNTFKKKKGDLHVVENGDNTWYNESLKLGNYWSDFGGPDRDDEHTLSSLSEEEFYYTEGGVVDKYPKGTYQKIPEIEIIEPEHLAQGVSLNPSLKVKITDPEGQRMDVSFYRIVDNVSHCIHQLDGLESGKVTNVKFEPINSYIGLGYNYICQWYVTAKDPYSKVKTETQIFTTKSTPIKNEEPVAKPGGPYTGYVGESIQFNASQSYDPDGEVIFHHWNFGDSVTTADISKPTHVYSNPGEYTGKLIIIDNNGSSDVKQFQVNINPAVDDDQLECSIAKPTDSQFNVDQSITFEAAASGGSQPYNFTWTIEGKNITKQNTSHVFEEKGNYTIKLTVKDSDGNKKIKTKEIEITISGSEESEKGIPGFQMLTILFALFTITIFFFAKKHKK